MPEFQKQLEEKFVIFHPKFLLASIGLGLLLLVGIFTACSSDAADAPAAPSASATHTVQTSTTAPAPTATAETVMPDVYATSTPTGIPEKRDLSVPGATSTPTSSISPPPATPAPTPSTGPIPTPTREPTESFTVHDLDVEPLVGSVFETLLSKMPDNEITRGYTRMGDVAGVLETLGVELLPPGASVEESYNFIRQFSKMNIDGFYPSFWNWPAELRDYANEYDTYPDLAYDWTTVDQFAQANSQNLYNGEPPRPYDVALGPFDAAATTAALSACDCDQPEIRQHAGIKYFAWSEGNGIGEIQDRHKRPLYDHIGRGPHLLVRDGEAYYSIRNGVIDEHIDVIQGTSPSLAELESYVSAVQWIASMGLISEITVRNFGFTVEEALPGFWGQATEAEIVQGSPLLLPFEMAATGVGYDGERTFTGLVIVHENADLVETNVGILLERIRNVTPARGGPDYERTWSYLLDRIEIQTPGRLMVARLYFTGSSGTRLMGISNNLLVHE